MNATIRKSLPASYVGWRNEVFVDFGDYTFTREELDALGIGLHTKAASGLTKHSYSLAEFRDMNMDSAWDLSGVGTTSLIVLGALLLATFPTFDLDRWLGVKGRTIAGGVRSATARKKRKQ